MTTSNEFYHIDKDGRKGDYLLHEDILNIPQDVSNRVVSRSVRRAVADGDTRQQAYRMFGYVPLDNDETRAFEAELDEIERRLESQREQ
jgi:hypothetical protein